MKQNSHFNLYQVLIITEKYPESFVRHFNLSIVCANVTFLPNISNSIRCWLLPTANSPLEDIQSSEQESTKSDMQCHSGFL